MEHRLRELNKARLQLEQRADEAAQEQANLEADLADRIAAMPAEQQQRYSSMQAEVRVRLTYTACLASPSVCCRDAKFTLFQ